MKKLVWIFCVLAILCGCYSEARIKRETISDIEANKSNISEIAKYIVERNINNIKVRKMDNTTYKIILKKMCVRHIWVDYKNPVNPQNDSVVNFSRHNMLYGKYRVWISYYFGKSERTKNDYEVIVDKNIRMYMYKRMGRISID